MYIKELQQLLDMVTKIINILMNSYSSAKKKKNKNKLEQSDDDFDIEPREKRKSTTALTNNSKPHKTSYLESVVDSYEDMNEKEREAYVALNTQRKTYYSIFKKIQYFHGSNTLNATIQVTEKAIAKEVNLQNKDELLAELREAYKIGREKEFDFEGQDLLS